jgi:hypothetical protein
MRACVSLCVYVRVCLRVCLGVNSLSGPVQAGTGESTFVGRRKQFSPYMYLCIHAGLPPSVPSFTQLEMPATVSLQHEDRINTLSAKFQVPDKCHYSYHCSYYHGYHLLQSLPLSPASCYIPMSQSLSL